MASAEATKIYLSLLGFSVIACFLSQTANLPDPVAHARPAAPAAHLFRENPRGHYPLVSAAAAASAGASPSALPLSLLPAAASSLVGRLEQQLEHKLGEFAEDAGASTTSSALAGALRLASLLAVSSGRAVWRGDGDLLLASANGEVGLAAAAG